MKRYLMIGKSLAVIAATLSLPMAAQAAPAVVMLAQSAEYINSDTPISIHNYLHYKQEADRLYKDYQQVLKRNGGVLSSDDREVLDARYRTLAIRFNQWVSSGYPVGRPIAGTMGRDRPASVHGVTPSSF